LDSTESGAYFRHYCALDYAASKMRAACRMTRWIYPDRPQELTREETLSVNQDPVVRRLVTESGRSGSAASGARRHNEAGTGSLAAQS